jgi:hypothetical protein
MKRVCIVLTLIALLVVLAVPAAARASHSTVPEGWTWDKAAASVMLYPDGWTWDEI